MFRKILVPVDPTGESRPAVDTAAELAGRLGASLLLIEIVPTAHTTLGLAADVAGGALTDPGVYGAEVAARAQAAEGYLQALAEELAGRGLDVAYTTGTGSAGAGIVEAARREHVDLIVMATHARNPLGRLVFGSVTDHVMRHAHVPVLAIPPPAGPRDG
jgi:nucleotide-binding universal stress UspA family protein